MPKNGFKTCSTVNFAKLHADFWELETTEGMKFRLDFFSHELRVRHAGLLHKFKYYGVSGQIFGLISSFLRNRRLRVVLDGKSSQEYPVNAGVSFKGSILGPTLFLLYINNLPDDVIYNIAIYADHTTLYSKCDQASDLWQQLD